MDTTLRIEQEIAAFSIARATVKLSRSPNGYVDEVYCVRDLASSINILIQARRKNVHQ